MKNNYLFNYEKNLSKFNLFNYIKKSFSKNKNGDWGLGDWGSKK